MPSRPLSQSLSLDRTPTPYPATNGNSDDRDKPPFFARLFSSASSAKKPQHHKSAGHVPASDLPPTAATAAASSSSTAAASSSADAGESSTQSSNQPKPTKLKFARTLSMPRLARTLTPYPEPQGAPKRKLSLSSLFGSKSSDETSSSSAPSTLQLRAQKRLAKLSLIRSPTPYPEQAHHSKPKSWWSAKKKQTITRDGARPQIVVLRKEPMRKAQSSMYVDGEAGSSREQENGAGQQQGVSTPVLNTDATVEIVDGTSKPASEATNSQPSASSSANTTPRSKLISFPSEPTINPNAASASDAAVARTKSTPNRRIHILEPDLQGVSRNPARRTGDSTPAASNAAAATASTATSAAEADGKSDAPSESTSTPAPASSDLAARGITIVESQIRPLPPPPAGFSATLLVSAWLATWLPLLAHLATHAPLVYSSPASPPTIRASMVSTSSSYHFSASDTDGDSDDAHADLGYPLDLGTLHAFLMHAAAASAQHQSAAARGAARLKRPRRRAMKRLGKGATLVKIRSARWFGTVDRDAREQREFGVPLTVEAAHVPVRGKHPRMPIPSEFYEDVRRVEVGGDVPPVPPLPMSPMSPKVPMSPMSPVSPEARKDDVQEDELPFASRACLDSVDPDTRAAFDDLMVDLTRHPSVKLSDPTTPLMRTVSSFTELAKKLTDRTREQSFEQDVVQPHHVSARRAPPPPPIPTDEVNMHFANLTDRGMVSPRSTHSSIRRRKPRPSSGISESTDWSGTGSSAAAPLTTTSRTSSRAPTMDSGYFPGSPPTLTSSSSTTGSTSFNSSNAMPGSPTSSSIPPVPVVPAWILANPSIFPPGPGSDLGSCSIATDVRPDSPDVRIEYAFHTDYATWVHHWKDLVKDTTFDQALQIGFRVPAGALGVKQVVTTGVAKSKDEDARSRRSSISVLRRFSNVSLASVSHAIRHPVDAVRGRDSPRGSLTPASSNASLRSSVLGGGSGGSGYHPSARPSVDGASSIASTVKSRKSLLERLRFGSLGSRRSSFMAPGMTSGSLSRDMPIQETDESEWSTATAPPGPVADKPGGGKLARKWSQRGKAAKKRLSKVFGSFGFGGAGSSGDEHGGGVEVEDGEEDEDDNVPLAHVMQRASSSMSFSSTASGSLQRASMSLPRQPGVSSAAMSLRGTLPRSTASGSMSLRAMYTSGPSTPAPAVASASAASMSIHGTSTAAALAHLTMRSNGGSPGDFGGPGSAMEPFSDEDDTDHSQTPLAPVTLDRQGRSTTFVPPPPKLGRSLSRATQRTWTSRSIGTPSTPKSAYFPSNMSVSAVSLASGGTIKRDAADEPCEIRRSVVLTEDVDVWTIRVSLTPNVCS